MIQKCDTKYRALSVVAVVLLILVINLTSTRFAPNLDTATAISSSICNFIRRSRCGRGCSLSLAECVADDYQITTIGITFVCL